MGWYTHPHNATTYYSHEDRDEDQGPESDQLHGCTLKPAKGETLHTANLRLNVTIGQNVGQYIRTSAKGSRKPRNNFPDCLELELFQEALVNFTRRHSTLSWKMQTSHNICATGMSEKRSCGEAIESLCDTQHCEEHQPLY